MIAFLVGGNALVLQLVGLFVLTGVGDVVADLGLDRLENAVGDALQTAAQVAHVEEGDGVLGRAELGESLLESPRIGDGSTGRLSGQKIHDLIADALTEREQNRVASAAD